MEHKSQDRDLLLRFVLEQLASKDLITDLPDQPKNLSNVYLEQIQVSSLLQHANSGTRFSARAVCPPPPRPSIPRPGSTTTSPANVSKSPSLAVAPPPPVPRRPAKPSETEFAAMHINYQEQINTKKTSPIHCTCPVWPLSPKEKASAAYESLLLCTNNLSSDSISPDDVQGIRELILPKVNLDPTLPVSILQNGSDWKVSVATSMEERVRLFKLDKSEFIRHLPQSPPDDTLEAKYKEWRDRQAMIIFNIALGHLFRYGEPTIELLEDFKKTPAEFLDELRSTLETDPNDPSQAGHLDGLISVLKNHLGGDNEQYHVPYPYPLNTKLYEPLLEACFAEGGKLLGRGDQARVFQYLSYFRMRYDISSENHTMGFMRANFRQFREYPERLELLSVVRDDVTKLRSAKFDRDTEEFNYRNRIVEEMAVFFREQLSDYRKNCVRTESLLGQYWGIFQDIVYIRSMMSPNASTKDYEDKLHDELKQFEMKSGISYYVRLSSAALKPWSADAFTEILQQMQKDVKYEIKYFLPQLATLEITPRTDRQSSSSFSFFLQEISRLYTNDVTEFLRHCSTLSTEIAALMKIFVEISKSFTDAGIDPNGLPNLVAMYSPLVSSFIQTQEEVLSTFVERSLQAETWTPVSEELFHSASALDIFEIFMQVTPFMFSLPITELCEFFVGTMSASINRTLHSYIHTLYSVTSGRNQLIPPCGNVRMKGKRESQVSALVGKKHESVFYLDPVTYQRFTEQKLSHLLCRLCNLLFVRDQLPAYKKILKDKAAVAGVPADDAFWDSRFTTSETEIDKGIAEMLKYIGTKIVFFHFRNNLLEPLYFPGVKTSPVKINEFLAQSVDPLLEGICSSTPESTSKDVIFWIYRMMIEAIHYVTMYAGNGRAFEPKDAAQILVDVRKTEDFFLARDEDGNPQGLPENIILKESSHFKKVCALLLSAPTEELLAQYNSLPESGDILNKRNILAVLMNRTDHDAKAHLKNQRLSPLYKNVKRGAVVISYLEGHRS
ncbi:hypothetical protein PROFUN_09646 [Planoprotostelium fungivorum]|uniref:Uncharacterized protein n=1 Tax=Planoprotostelium fungivorum TaxID=1890364 RepID=A0A2P6MP23_9EUKA|nr:hypothetical protein PROFUN_09646 [Planoprotostelium fungivorum]